MKTNFQRIILGVGLCSISLLLSGCVVSVGSRMQTTPPPPPAVVVTDSADAATVAEIDAGARLGVDSARAQTLTQIAERPHLAVPVQVHLINTAYRCLSFENHKVQILQKLIARPDFCHATRHAIVSQLGRLSFESNKQDLLNRIHQRLATKGPS